MKHVLSGVCAGLCISLGGAVFLACESRLAGAVLFSVALTCICYKGYALFTGRVGYIPEKHDKAAVSALLLGLLGNLVGTVLCGWLIRAEMPNLGQSANALCLAKLEQSALSTLTRGLFCGVLMYLAVSIFRDSKTPLGILLCIPAFILSGFEHSIADMFYFAASGLVSLKAFAFLWLVILSNAVGGMLLPTLSGAWRRDKQNA